MTNQINGLTAYEITFKIGPRTLPKTWTRYAASIEAATVSALEVLNNEYYGKAKLISVQVK